MTPITALGSRYGIQGALGRSVKRVAAGGTWWDLNGTITSCVAAYQAKGAASYAASKVNLANSGTYALAEIGGGAINWDSSIGWYGFNSLTRCLDTGIYPGDNMTWIVRFTRNGTANQNSLFGHYLNNSRRVEINPIDSTGGYYSNPAYRNFSISDGTVCVARNNCYNNGTFLETIFADWGDDGTQSVLIGSRRREDSSSIDNYCLSNILAFANYDAVLTGTQVGALTTAMNSL